MKVRSHLVLTVAAAMLPLIVFSAIGLRMLLDAEREAALNRVRETVRATALLVDRELTNAQAALNVLGTSYLLKTGNFEAFHAQVQRTNVNRGTWTVLFAPDGQQLFNTLVPYGTSLPKVRNAQSGPLALEGQTIHVTGLVSGLVRKDWLVALEVPVYIDGERRYVLSQGFSPEYFVEILTRQGKPEGWISAIIDKEGINIARSQRARDYIGKRTVPELIADRRERTEGLIQARSLDGIDVYAVHARSEFSGWTVAVGVPREEIERAARSAVLVVALGLLTALICATLTAVLFGRRLVQAMQDAERSAVALGRGMEPRPIRSGVAEVDRLHAVLGQTGAMLSRERQSRQQAEAERTRLLVSEQEARRVADAQNRAKDEFLAMLGHELRNPLAAISGAFSVMELSRNRPDALAQAQAIGKRQVGHLSRIVDDLLDIGRIMAGKIQLKRQPVELSEFVGRCMEARRNGHGSRHAWTLQAEVSWTEADPTRLEQILGNVLGNAEKYTPEGGSIVVRVHEQDGEAVVQVQDNGIGIAPELMATIFDTFVQGPTSIDRSQGGLGLGLALVRQLMQLHGGSVQVESAGANAGSTFTLRFPRCMPPEQSLQVEPALPERIPAREVAVIEDNDDGRLMLQMTLELQGLIVKSYPNGEEALAEMARRPPGIAIIDIGLPGMDGYEIACRLKQNPETSTIRLVALTGYGLEQDRQAALNAGFDVHLSKPYTAAQLLAAMTPEMKRAS